MRHKTIVQKLVKFLLLFGYFTVFLLALFVIAFEVSYAYKMYPHTFVAGIDIGGQTKSQATEILVEKTDVAVSRGLDFKYKDTLVNIDSTLTGLSSGDFFGQVFLYDVNKTVNNAYIKGHIGGWVNRAKEQINNFLQKNSNDLVVNLDKEALKNILKNNFEDLQEASINASLDIAVNGEVSNVEIIGEKSGIVFDYDKAIDQALYNLQNLKEGVVQLEAIEDYPTIIAKDLGFVASRVKEVINLAPVIFTYEEKEWELSKVELASWLMVEKNNQNIDLVISKDSSEGFFAIINDEIKIEALDAKFEMQDGRVVSFQTSQSGRSLNFEKTIQEVIKKLITEKNSNIELVVEEVESRVKNSETNDLGVIEIIGRGVSDFSGSPANRIHNITTGANRLNGLLVKPGEVFKLMDTLGEIDGENGYKQELVIKGNKTIPEYGGGLCQIGTTIFRAALQSGLPIVERRNHSYNVSYYAPTGTDATIYDPWPDFKFLNDTANHILIVTKIEGNKLIFEIWGTKDGRSVLFEGKEKVDNVENLVPVVFNIVKPGEPKFIETDTLEPGKKKRIEYGHNGADASFDYVVTYADGEKKEETFNSHYIPWKEVWLVGVEKVVEEGVIDSKKEIVE